MKKLALVIGHNHKSKGAYSPYLKQYEYDYNKKIANEIYNDLNGKGVEVKIFERYPSALGYTTEIEQAYSNIKWWLRNEKLEDTAIIELHFNASSNFSANGCEVLVSKNVSFDEKSLPYELIKEFSMHFKSRGIKRIDINERGGRSLYQLDNLTIIAEPFFGSSPYDSKEVMKNEVGSMYINAISTYWNLPSSNTSDIKYVDVAENDYLNIRSLPDVYSDKMGHLGRLTKVKVVERNGDWARIAIANEVVGWVNSIYLGDRM